MPPDRQPRQAEEELDPAEEPAEEPVEEPDEEPDEEQGDGPADGDGPPPSVRRLARQVRARSSVLRCTLAAAGAWAITVAPLALAGRAGAVTRVLALVAVLPGLAGPQLISARPRMARHVGVSTFLAICLGAWALASWEQLLVSVDMFRAILGVLAWGVFALAWSHPWSVADGDLRLAPPGETAGLKPRRKPSPAAVGVAAVGALMALVCLAIAWRVEDPSRAVLAQAVAVGCAIAMLTSASTVAVLAGREQRQDRRGGQLPIDRRVINTLALMVVVAGLSLALWWTR